jgi:hypothetical protein
VAGANKNTIKKVSTAESWRELLDTMSLKKNAQGVDYKSAVIRQLLLAAAKGKEWAVKYVLDQQLGKALQLQRTDLTSGGESLNANVSFVGSNPIVNSLPIADTGADDTIQAIEPTSDTLVTEGEGSA